MSIFEKYNNVEELLNNDSDESINIFYNLLIKFVEYYQDLNTKQKKLKNFYDDIKRLFSLISKYYKMGIEEYKDEDDFNENSNEYKKVLIVIKNCDSILELLQSENVVIDEEKSKKINNYCLEIIEFHNEVIESTNELNKMMSDTCDKLDILGAKIEIDIIIRKINEIKNEIFLLQKNDLSINYKLNELSAAYNKFKELKDKINDEDKIYKELEETICLLLCKFGIEGIKLS